MIDLENYFAVCKMHQCECTISMTCLYQRCMNVLLINACHATLFMDFTCL